MGSLPVRPFIGLSVASLVKRVDRELGELAEALDAAEGAVAAEGVVARVREMVAEIRRVDRANRDVARHQLEGTRRAWKTMCDRAEQAEALLEGLRAGETEVGVPSMGVCVEAESFTLDVVYEPDYVVRTRVPDLLEAYQDARSLLMRALDLLPDDGQIMDGTSVAGLEAELRAGIEACVPLEICMFVPDMEPVAGEDEPLVRLYRANRAECDAFNAQVSDSTDDASSNSTEYSS